MGLSKGLEWSFVKSLSEKHHSCYAGQLCGFRFTTKTATRRVRDHFLVDGGESFSEKCTDALDNEKEVPDDVEDAE
jgi:hypothetical protein